MNLHNIRPSIQTAWLWTDAYGGNGRYLGVHLWSYDLDEPPAMEEHPPGAYHWWTPRRFSWTPFNRDLIARSYMPWQRPLCGKRSRSNSVRMSFSGVTNASMYACEGCLRVANQRGILPSNLSAIRNELPIWVTIQAEYAQWRQENQR